MGDVMVDIGTDLLSTDDPKLIMSRLVQHAVDSVQADRCTFTSLDQHLMRVEASFEVGSGAPAFVGHEYPLEAMNDQPLLRDAVATGHIVTGVGFAQTGRVDPELRQSLEVMHRTAVIPLPVGDRVGAALILSRRAERDFATAELHSLQQIGVMAVLALRNARLASEVHEAQWRGLDALTRISAHMASSDDPQDFFARMSETVAQLTGAHRAVFWLIDGDELVAQQGCGFSPEQLQLMRIPLPKDPGARLLRGLYHGEALRFGSDGSTLSARSAPVLALMGVRDGLAVPWRTAQTPIGIVATYDSTTGFSEQEEWVLRLAARASALVWQGFEAEHRAAALQAAEVDRLADHAARVASLDEQKSEFLRLASHELRTPITLVRGYLSMLEEGSLGELPPEAARVMPVMSSRMSQMNVLVERMLAASRAEESGFQAALAEVRMDALVRRVVTSLEGLLRSSQRVLVESQGEVTAVADADKTETIVANLVSNAIKYSPDGGDITVRVAAERDEVTVDVADRGIGVDHADLPRLFRPFGRVEAPRTEGIEGTGLGLYVSRRLARLQGGDIKVESQPDVGSTFTLSLPRAAAM